METIVAQKILQGMQALIDYYNPNNTVSSKVYLSDSNGEAIDSLHPLSVSSNHTVRHPDINETDSNLYNFTGSIVDLFDSLDTYIEDTTTDAVKSLKISFNYSIQSSSIGFGCNDPLKSFSNIKIKLLGSAGVERAVFDLSTDNTKRNSYLAEFPASDSAFNSILIEFHTTDTVTLSNLVIFRSHNTNSRLRAHDRNGVLKDARASSIGSLNVALTEYQGDAFGRLRVSEPYTVFDNSLTSPASDTLFWSTLTNGTASGAYDRNTSKYTLSTLTSGDYIVRQTKQRFKYQPGKSQLILITGLFKAINDNKYVVGAIDYDNVGLGTITNTPQNGIGLMNDNGTVSFVIYNNGVLTEQVTQANWNVDKADGTADTRFTLDIDSTNILYMDIEWLGVGAVRCGFVNSSGEIIVCHQFQHASLGFTDVYMRTANLPVSYALTSADGACDSTQICTSVISEGGFNPTGLTRAITNPTAVAISSGTTEVVLAMRLKEDFFEYTIDPTFVSILALANANSLWYLSINPTYTGSLTWNDVANSSVQVAYGSAFPVTNLGTVVAGGTFSNDLNSLNESITTALKIGKSLTGALDELCLIVHAIGNDSYHGCINYKEYI